MSYGRRIRYTEGFKLEAVAQVTDKFKPPRPIIRFTVCGIVIKTTTFERKLIPGALQGQNPSGKLCLYCNKSAQT